MLGARKGVLYWWTPVSHELWRMGTDGSGRRVIGLAPTSPILGDDGIYFANRTGEREAAPIERIDLDGGGQSTVSSYDKPFYPFAADDGNVYATSAPSVWRLPVDGSPPVELAPFHGAGGQRLGSGVMWLSRADFLGHIDPRGAAMPEIRRVAEFPCWSFAVGAPGAACEYDGGIHLVDTSGKITPLVASPSTFPRPGYLKPSLFARHQEKDGLVFVKTPTSGGASIRWVSLDGGSSKELTCGGEQLTVDGDALFMFAAARDATSRSTRALVRVDLR